MFVVVIGFLVRQLPRRASLWLGARIGDFVYRFVKERRQTALANLRMALGGEKGDAELTQIARRSFRNMGKTLVEFLCTPKYSLEQLLSLVQIRGVENYRQAMATGKGTVVFSAHLGNWEIIFQTVASIDNHMTAVAQSLKYSRLDKLVNSYRTRYGGYIIEKRVAVHQTLRRLRQGWCVAFLADQDAGDSGVFVHFFGKLASTSRGPVMFALRTGAPILSLLDIRLDDGTHLITFSRPLNLEITGDLENDIRVNTARLAEQLEELVREYPSQWLWMHNRWKTRPSSIGE